MKPTPYPTLLWSAHQRQHCAGTRWRELGRTAVAIIHDLHLQRSLALLFGWHHLRGQAYICDAASSKTRACMSAWQALCAQSWHIHDWRNTQTETHQNACAGAAVKQPLGYFVNAGLLHPKKIMHACRISLPTTVIMSR